MTMTATKTNTITSTVPVLDDRARRLAEQVSQRLSEEHHLHDFVTGLGVRMTFAPAPPRKLPPKATAEEKRFNEEAGHWSCTLTNAAGVSFTTSYSKGAGHRVWKDGARWAAQGHGVQPKAGESIPQGFGMGRRSLAVDELYREHTMPTPPCVEEVLEALVYDAVSVEGRDFAEWCADLGYDSDSISAKSAYDACVQTKHDLVRLMGQKNFDQLVERT